MHYVKWSTEICYIFRYLENIEKIVTKINPYTVLRSK